MDLTSDLLRRRVADMIIEVNEAYGVSSPVLSYPIHDLDLDALKRLWLSLHELLYLHRSGSSLRGDS